MTVLVKGEDRDGRVVGRAGLVGDEEGTDSVVRVRVGRDRASDASRGAWKAGRSVHASAQRRVVYSPTYYAARR